MHEKTDLSHPLRDQGTASAAGAAATAETRRDVEYAHGKVQEEVEEAPGRIERITVGIVVPGKLAPTDIKQLSDVIAAGIGLDASRGDRIDIAAIAPWTPPERHAIAVVKATPAGAKPASPLPADDSVPAFARIWNLPRWSYAALGIGILLLGMFMGSRVRRRRPRRLTATEREANLEQLMEWIKQPEQVP